MQVSVETLSDLERQVTVQVPTERFAKDLRDRLLSLSRQVKVDGFRPGRAPLRLVQRIYGERVRYETITALIENSLREALSQERLSPLGTPKIEVRNLEDGQNLEYSAIFEVMPEFQLAGFDNIQIERPVAEVTDQDIEIMIKTLQIQQAVWHSVDRPSSTGDRIRIDFEGTIDGNCFTGGKSSDVSLILGKNSMLKDFEDSLIGLDAGSQTTFDLNFPESYQDSNIAGKTANFRVKLHTVEEAILPNVDEAFAERFDIKVQGVAGLRESLRKNMERELHGCTKAIVKRQVMQWLLDTNKIPLPKILIEVEVGKLTRELCFPKHNKKEVQQFETSILEHEARRRVALGLLIYQLAEIHNIRTDELLVHEYLESIASTYQEPAEMLKWYEQTPQALDNVRALVLEDQIVDWVLERAHIIEKASTFAEVVASS
jgi:trigger factor